MRKKANLVWEIEPYGLAEVFKARCGTSFNPASDNWVFITNSGVKKFDLAQIKSL